MTAIKNNNTIIIRNIERQSEDVFFNKIIIAFENNIDYVFDIVNNAIND